MTNQWQTIGISPEERFLDLYFEPESEQFLAHFYEQLGDGFGVKSLYARHFNENEYHKITPDNKKLTYENVILCPESRKIFVNVFKLKKKLDKYLGYVWHSLQMIDSDTGEVTEVLKAGQLDSERPYAKVWITELRRARNNGEQLVCTMAFEKKTKKGTIETDYFITKVFTKTGLYKRVTKLEDTATQNCKTGIIEEKVSAVGA
ncbi:MAG: hypothetical protein KAJ31_03915 [Deltaproteobacteria bacterium]|nr:hypothetical protein [Deltaproteobacteria bacterium]